MAVANIYRGDNDIRRTPIPAGQIKKNKKKSTNIKRDENNVMNITNDNN